MQIVNINQGNSPPGINYIVYNEIVAKLLSTPLIAHSVDFIFCNQNTHKPVNCEAKMAANAGQLTVWKMQVARTFNHNPLRAVNVLSW